MKTFDFYDTDNWQLIACCWLYSPGEETAEIVEYMLEEMVVINNAVDVDVWDYGKTKANCEPDSRFAEKGTCDHCGAHFNYGAAYRHAVTKEVAIVGHICAAHQLSLPANDYVDKKLREAAKRARTRAANRKRWDEEIYPALTDDQKAWLETDHYISKDLNHKLYIYGSLSDRQWELAEKIFIQVKEDAESKANEPAPAPIPAELLEGRNKFTGTILGTKWQESMYGDIPKMLFLDDRGFKLWGTVPTTLPKKTGARVEFYAAVSASDDDPKFGFFHRPTKAIELETPDE